MNQLSSRLVTVGIAAFFGVVILLSFDARGASKDEIYAAANRAYDERRYEEALDLYDKLIEQGTRDPDVFWWGAMAAQNMRDYRRSAGYLVQLKELGTLNFDSRERLVIALQRIGDMPALEKEREGLINFWRGLPEEARSKRRFFVRDVFEAGRSTVIVSEYFELIGKFARRYHFLSQVATGSRPFTVSLGSYEMLTRIERQLGRLSETERLYHLDGYDGRKHYTYAFFKREPAYDQVRSLAAKIIANEDRAKFAVSSSSFRGGVLP